ncbi:MAG: DUF4111 domain-containing protein [Pseudonocardiales bacterium]|nr:DUF4111 domain-containing protein [Pseudonocardiales bacterium]
MAIPAATGQSDVDRILDTLIDQVRKNLPDQFVGMYLYGSLSSGDFDPGSRDIDFLVVTKSELSDAEMARLADMHASIKAGKQPFADRLEGSYIPLDAVRRYDPEHSDHPLIGVDWDFGVIPHGWNWVLERAIIRQSGKALAGPPPDTLIDPVSPDELRAAVRHQLFDFWGNIGEPDWLGLAAYQAFSILTTCRALHTLSTGTLTSKPVAAEWAGRMLGSPWKGHIAWTLEHRHDFTEHDPGPAHEFIRNTLQLVGGTEATP